MTVATRYDFEMYACDDHEITVQLINTCDNDLPPYTDDKTCFAFFVRMPGSRKKNFIHLTDKEHSGIKRMYDWPEPNDLSIKIKIKPALTSGVRIKGEEVACPYELVISHNGEWDDIAVVRTIMFGTMTIMKGRGVCGDCGDCSECNGPTGVC